MAVLRLHCHGTIHKCIFFKGELSCSLLTVLLLKVWTQSHSVYYLIWYFSSACMNNNRFSNISCRFTVKARDGLDIVISVRFHTSCIELLLDSVSFLKRENNFDKFSFDNQQNTIIKHYVPDYRGDWIWLSPFSVEKTNQIQKVPHMKMGTLSCETRIYIQYFQKSENRWLRYIFGNRV